MQDWILTFVALTGISAAGFVVVAVLWLCKLRETVSVALAESASQQVQPPNVSVRLWRKCKNSIAANEQQLQNLAQANTQTAPGIGEHSFPTSAWPK